MPAWTAPTVTNIAAAGQTAAKIFQDAKERFAGQAAGSAGGQGAGTQRGSWIALGQVQDQYGNLADVMYDPVGNVIYTVAR